MGTGKKIFIHSPQLENLPYPAASPFNTSRAGRVRKLLDSMGLLSGPDREQLAPSPVGRAALEKFHSPAYLDAMEKAAGGGYDAEMFYMGLGTGDCPVFEAMYEYGNLAADATLLGAEKIITGRAKIAFNPSGGLHHARSGCASGFCYINDMVLGCMRLAEAGKRVLYLDVDVHHGDGVQDAFYDRDDVMTVSMHQTGRTLFPGTGFIDEIGTGKGKGLSVNLPLPVGTYDDAYLYVFSEAVLPLITAWAGDVFVVEFGADALAGDPLANLALTNNVYAEIIRTLLRFDKPILATGGGGYDIENTTRAWALVWAALCGDDVTAFQNSGMGTGAGRSNIVDAEIEEVIEAVKSNIFGLHGL